jgi:hypothetical protein
MTYGLGLASLVCYLALFRTVMLQVCLKLSTSPFLSRIIKLVHHFSDLRARRKRSSCMGVCGNTIPPYELSPGKYST